MQINNQNFSPNNSHENYHLFLVGIMIVAGIAGTNFINFLLFHTIAESFSIVVASSIFIVAWNTRHISNNNYLLFLGIIYLFVGILDFTHTLAYKGMNIFSDHGANLPTQLWIASRYLESISLAIAPIYFTRRLNIYLVFWICLGLCILILISLFVWPLFPDCYNEGSGLTAFKKNSEYMISLILSIAIVNLYRKRDYLESSILHLIIMSLILTIISEIAFTFYVNVYGISNLVGHLFKIISFYLIYRAVVVVTLTNPYNSLFREVVKSENKKKQVIGKLKKSLEQVKLLEGFLPICASCKQIRDDKGYWNQIEKYISDHSEVEFSHGICPKCAEKLYPEFYSKQGKKKIDFE